ncbi:MAG: 30S ribosomal protein S4 [Bacteroidetes bacterium]|nr:30S ribosomal protein S4 [Bacteroidota bacterium]
MARYTGSKSKIARKFGEAIYGFDKAFEKKNYPPGQHGQNRRRKVKSDYAVQLMEKQKAKYTYGILEKQFRNLYKEATRKKGITGEILLQLLEARLDNTVYRLGIAPTRPAARQIVSHKHVTVNGKSVNIPSYTLKAGDVIGFRAKSAKMEIIAKAPKGGSEFPWLEWDEKSDTGKFLDVPERDKIPEKIREQLIVELYSK